MKPFLDDGDVQLYVGDSVEVLKHLPAKSVQCVVTSPPYWGLRDYQTGVWVGGDPGCDHKQTKTNVKQTKHPNADNYPEGAAHRGGNPKLCPKCGAVKEDSQLGLEATPEEYVENMVAVFREVHRVLRDDGTCWLNLGDSYATDHAQTRSKVDENGVAINTGLHTKVVGSKATELRGPPPGLKPKDLCGIPWRIAFALQANGWWLRSDIIWVKNVMPESVRDRPTKTHEYLFLLTKNKSYFYDQQAIMEQAEWARWGDQTNHKHQGSESAASWIKPKTKEELKQRGTVGRGQNQDRGDLGRGGFYESVAESGLRNARSVWKINTESYAEAHFATFPKELPRRCIKAGTSEVGCCPSCGAPWVRETERDRVGVSGDWRGHKDEEGVAHAERRGFKGSAHTVVGTTGWRPSCEHGLNPVACVVLDPFGGSGTTAFVARELGRRSVLIELSEAYAGLCAQRLQQLSLLA